MIKLYRVMLPGRKTGGAKGKGANATYAIARKDAEMALTHQAMALARAQQLHQSRQQIIAALEGLRRDLAARFHILVQEELLVLKAEMQEALTGLNPSLESSQLLSKVAKNLGRIIDEAGFLSQHLYPSLINQGIVVALRFLASQFENYFSIEVEPEEALVREERVDPNLVPESVRLAAYRIAQEALTNTVKHSRATRATVRLDLPSSQWLRLRVTDNGMGFGAEGTQGHGGMAAMQDYAEAAGGRFTVRSAPGSGTEVEAIFPITPADSEPAKRALL